MKRVIIISKFIVIILIAVATTKGVIAQGIMAPSGTGAWGNMIYAGLGITHPQPYTIGIQDAMSLDAVKKYSDMVASFGFGLGNPYKNVGVQIGSNMLDVSQADLFNFGIKIHRYVAAGISVSAGIENLFFVGKGGYFSFSPGNKSDASPNQYIAMTQDFRYLFPDENFISRLSYSIGGGTGRFSELAPLDKINYNREKATYIFGAAQLRMTKNFSFSVDWSGANLNAGLSFNAKLGKIPIGFILAAADLTKYSGTGVRIIGAGGIFYQFGGKKTETPPSNDESSKLTPSSKSNVKSKNANTRQYKYEAIIRENELLAQMDNMQDHNENILANNVELSKKVQVLEQQVQKLNSDLTKVKYEKVIKVDESGNEIKTDDKYVPDDTRKKRNDNTAVDLNTDDVVKVTQEDDAGYAVEPGCYIVIHSLTQRKWAEATRDNYRKIGIETKIAYNKDKEVHYVYTEKYPLNQLREALAKSTEQREKGFKGAWVFKKEADVNAVYYESEPRVDSLKYLSDNEIVKVNEGDQSGFAIEKGKYLIIKSLKLRDEAVKEAKSLTDQGFKVKVMYDHTREQHYIYTEKFDDVSSALAKREQIKKDFKQSWVMITDDKPVVAKVEGVNDAEVSKIPSLSKNEITKIDQGDGSNTSLDPGNYVVIGSFRDVNNARKDLQMLRGLGVKAYIGFNKDLDLYYVYTDVINDKRKALERRNQMKQRFADAWVFSY